MSVKKIIGALVISCVLIPAVTVRAQATDDIKSYFSAAAAQVKAESDPDQKREFLHDALQRMTMALEKVQGMPFVSEKDRAGMDVLKSELQEKQDELTGRNGFDPIPDAQLNSFADYVVQDMEQADRTVTVSVVTALLVVIILILIL